jgi:4-hydroxythreonine-4-phosphate dehydrogenase
MASPLPPLLLTMGDPVGIGPEVIVRAFQRGAADDCVVVGDGAVIARALDLIGSAAPVARLQSPLQPAPSGSVPVWSPLGAGGDLSRLPWGQVDARAGRAAAW